MEKVDRIEVALEEMKDQQRPLSSKDYIHSLKNETAVELDEWLTTVKITKKQVRILLEEKSYLPVLGGLNARDPCVFSILTKHSLLFVDGKWKNHDQTKYRKSAKCFI